MGVMNKNAAARYATIEDYLLSRKGQFVTVHFNKNIKTLKSSPVQNVIAHVVRQAQVGVDYDNKAIVEHMRANGQLPSENAGLPYGKWDKFPYTIIHNGEKQFRFYYLKDSNGHNKRGEITYKDENGNSLTENQVREFCGSNFKENDAACFNVKFSNIEEVI